MSFNDVLGKMNDLLYTYVLIVLLVAVGIYFTIRTKGVQFRLFLDGIKSIMESPEKKKLEKRRYLPFRH